ncbi:type II toxin-antitoxin system VapC family toxin [uncultured Methanobrevibacter sp.]|uniref:type II toxin-antitoxin system VapC family toxin n=1 Tax=uncultured Methanobrevibacter sp. TaxID=253161 RepID=UPI002626984D|nr:type II toxin-antitoxin system VapC family toxin [uncultured Methanobrevibacter sp.]
MEIYFVLDASAFINGFALECDNNYTVPEITEEVKDFESKLTLDMAIDEGKLIIQDVDKKYIGDVDKIISESGDILRLSIPDKKLIALALMLKEEGKNVKVMSDDYTIQNTLKIIDVPYSGIITEGIKGIYNWKKVCEGCKKEFDENYPFDDCDICGSKVFKKRIKL